MKRIYLYGRGVRIVMLLSFGFLLWAFTDMYIQSDYSLANLALLILGAVAAVCVMVWMYSMGIFLDRKHNKLRIVMGFLYRERKEISLDGLESVDVALNGNLGMTFVIRYTYHRTEHFEHRFFRISFLEKWQFSRIKRQLDKMNARYLSENRA
ncbi:MAG: hypothetical protein E7594_05925 [Ruminococcaceae bacterium]|nr:hypothetical protein [Oscillospiraceae bacterium]